MNAKVNVDHFNFNLSISTGSVSADPIQDALKALKNALSNPDPPKGEAFTQIRGPKKNDKV